ncbi:hypothetical protein PoB_006098200 [Plakobranchus ocellatus]|uniref:Uncharacterized protein n=1 Tax=Plakobranchus ocellatus TaxID=259542 RepID=A0AAV4CRF4_9GAST|nr:hypothetical protein PoB_006098200 [Plakobranchus ocellatus]
MMMMMMMMMIINIEGEGGDDKCANDYDDYDGEGVIMMKSTTKFLRLSGPPSGQGAGGGARTRDRRVPVDLRADSLVAELPTPEFV